MLNHITIMGRVVRDPDLKYTQAQIPVATFTIAVERDHFSSGDTVTDFINIVAWRNTAEFAKTYFSKGRMMIVTGSLQTRKWEDKQGNKRTSYEVIADHIYFGDSAKRSTEYVPTEIPSSGGFDEIFDDDGDIPF